MRYNIRTTKKGVPIEKLWDRILVKATTNTLNDMRKKMKTVIKREVSRHYYISQKDVFAAYKKAEAKEQKATASKLIATITTGEQDRQTVMVGRFNTYGSRGSNPRKEKPYVTLEVIRGKKGYIPGAWMGRNPHNKTLVFAWQYAPDRHLATKGPRRGQVAIVPVKTISIASMAASSVLQYRYYGQYRELWDKRFAYFLMREVNKYRGRK